MSGERILVVDDSAQMREFLARVVLPVEGYTAMTARDGTEGLASALANSPDLIITDLAMPEMDGLEMVEELRRAGREIPVILMTAEGSEDIAVRAMRLGVKDYFVKPFEPDELLAAIDRILCSSRISAVQAEGPEQRQDQGLNTLIAIGQFIQQMRDPFLVIDSGGRIVLCNPAAARFFEKSDGSDPCGQWLADLTDNRSLLGLLESIEKDAATQGEVLHPDGQTFNATVSNIDGIGYAIVMQDITALKELDRMKTELVETVSHQVRSPLTAILSYIELLTRTGNLNSRQAEYARQLRDNVRLATQTVNDLLELRRLEAEVDGGREAVDLGTVARYVVEALQGRADAKNQQLVLDAGGKLPAVMGNPVQLRQMCINLVENAIKYTPEGGMVRVAVASEGEQVVLRVTDTGVGIAPADQPHIFERFYRGRSLSGQYDGTGLGLSIVKTIVDSHGGRIWVDSRVGMGTTFTIVLPASSGPGNEKSC